LDGLIYLHSRNVIHRDIKGANILLDKNLNVKISDFGTAKKVTSEEGNDTCVGTPYWMAPEMISQQLEVTTAVDIWSLGCTIVEGLTGMPPYSQMNHF
jgi:mitogen-activated protein kinase kinase kinase 3